MKDGAFVKEKTSVTLFGSCFRNRVWPSSASVGEEAQFSAATLCGMVPASLDHASIEKGRHVPTRLGYVIVT